MEKMTELEKHIYDSIKDRIPALLEKIRGLKVETRFIDIPFICDGCIDHLIYDKKVGRFVRIEYTKGVGKGTSIGGLMPEYTAYFDEVEHKEFMI